MAFSVVKYGLLNLSYLAEGVAWTPGDRGGASLLHELGFALHADEVPKPAADDPDPTCLSELDQDIDKNETLLRLFLEREPGRTGTFERMKEMLESGKAKRIFKANEADYWVMADECFPHEFVITDACLTNAGFVWFHKHFYL